MFTRARRALKMHFFFPESINTKKNSIDYLLRYLEQQILQILSVSEYENSNETSSESEGVETSKQ